MAEKEQIFSIIKKIKENRPAKAINKVFDIESGMRFVLMYLIETRQEVYASTISDKMNISRARVGILLKKMEAKGYITKVNSNKDARIDVLCITPKGLSRCNELKHDMEMLIAKLIDGIGYDEFNHFMDTAFKLKDILKEK